MRAFQKIEMIFENMVTLHKHKKTTMNTSEITERLARIENLILGMNKDATASAQDDVCMKKLPTQVIASRPGLEPTTTQVCKVRYDILAVNIKNKLQKLFQTKELEVTWLEEIDFEDIILSSLNPIECNELIMGSNPPPPQNGLQTSTRSDTDGEIRMEPSHEMVVDDEKLQAKPTKSTKASSKKTSDTASIDKEALTAEKEAKEYETAIKKMEKAKVPKTTARNKEADSETTTAEKKKADKEAKELAKKAEKEAKELEKKAEKEAKELEKKAEKEAMDAKKKAEKEAMDAKKKAEKENKPTRKRTTKDTTSSASQSLVSQSQPILSQQPDEYELSHDSAEFSNKSTTSETNEEPSTLSQPPPPASSPPQKLSLIHPSTYKQIKDDDLDSGKRNEEYDEEEENSTNTEDEEEEESSVHNYDILTSWSIPSKPEVLYFVKKGTYIYECVKNEENPKGEINWNTSVGLIMGAKIIYTMNYKHYESLIIQT